MSLPAPKSRSTSRSARKARATSHPKSSSSVRHLGDRLARIDSPIQEPTEEIAANPPVDLDIALAEMGFLIDGTDQTETTSPREWLTYHASDLIDRLTQWSDDLTVREANLHAQQAMWDRQARRLRLQLQETQFELDEIEARLQRSQEAIAEREEQLRTTARRLALASM